MIKPLLRATGESAAITTNIFDFAELE